jgi:NADH dehydrogenase
VFQYRDKGTLLSLGEAGAVGRLRVMLDDDLQIRGRLARAAYRGVQRRHQMLLLGVTKALLDGASNFLETRVGPRIKVH